MFLPVISQDIMPKDNQILVRVNDPTNSAIEEFAEDRDYNKAEAVREIAKSRLTSEGYLNQELYGNPDAIPDGGEVKQKLDSVEEKLDSTEEKIGREQRNQNYLNLILVVSLVWIGIQLVVELGAFITGVTGISLIAVIAYFYYQIYQEVSHE